jgi:hypothetical protein
MKLGARVDLIMKVARTLSEKSFTDIDLLLRQGDLSTSHWHPNMDPYEYCVQALEPAPDNLLHELDDYLHSTTDAIPGDAPWVSDKFHIFLTHVATHKAEAATLKQDFLKLGIEGFVAHEDIEPTKKWQQVIEAALLSCDALVALLHDGFQESPWCDQEVGYVLGRNIPVVPVAFDQQPYGFFGALQSLRADTYTGQLTLAAEIARLLLTDPRTGTALTGHLVAALVSSRNWAESNVLAPLLADYAPLVTREQVRRLREAQESNIEVREATHVERSIKRMVERFSIEEPAQPLTEYSDEEPF